MISRKILTLLVIVLCLKFYSANNEVNNTVLDEELKKLNEDLEKVQKDKKEAQDELDSINETLAGNSADTKSDEMDLQFKDAMVQLGIDKSETIDRATFRKLFAKVILEDEEPQGEEKQMFDNLINRVVNNAPETFPTKDLPKYVDMSFISDVLNEIMTEAGVDMNSINQQMEDGAELIEKTPDGPESDDEDGNMKDGL